jgi:hypothetical protein
MDHTIDWYIGLVDELATEFEGRNTLFDEIDKMVRPEWSLPASFTAVVKDVMAIVDTAPSDAINSGAIALSGSLPVFNVQPFMANVAEYDRAQNLEDTISWHFRKSNRRGNGTFMYDIAESSLRYNTICVRVDDLAHILPKSQKKWTPLQKRAWSYGRFIHTAYNPKGVYYLESAMGVTTVAHVETFKVQNAIKHWELYENNDTDEGRQVAQGLKDLKEAVSALTQGAEGKNAFSMRDIFLTQTYCIDDDKLMVWGSLTDSNGDDMARVNDMNTLYQFVFADQKNPYGFIPWSIRVAGSRLEGDIAHRVNPLLAPLYWSGSWDKLNLAKSVIFSEPIRRARAPRLATMTQSGEPPAIDYENGGDIALRVGESTQGLQPITLDQGAMAIVGQLESAMNRTTGASMIGDTTKISSNTPFATFSAMVKVALSRLDKQTELLGDTVSDVACLDLWWVDKTDVPLTYYAEEAKRMKSGNMRAMGMKTEVSKTDYSLNSLGLSVKIRPKTPTDRMEMLNMAVILSTKLNVPASQLLEEMGYENVGLMYELWTREFLKNAETQAMAAGMAAEAQTAGQLKAQAEAQKAQQQQQQPQQGAPGQPPPDQMGAGGGVSETSFGAMGGQTGMNPAVGGMSPTQGAPTMTREAITGQDRLAQQR